MTDLTGTDCPHCYGGTMQELTPFCDQHGYLLCTNCGGRTDRWGSEIPDSPSIVVPTVKPTSAGNGCH